MREGRLSILPDRRCQSSSLFPHPDMPLLDYSIFPSSLFPYGMLTYLNFLSRAEIRLRRKTFLLWETSLGPYLANFPLLYIFLFPAFFPTSLIAFSSSSSAGMAWQGRHRHKMEEGRRSFPYAKEKKRKTFFIPRVKPKPQRNAYTLDPSST